MTKHSCLVAGVTLALLATSCSFEEACEEVVQQSHASADGVYQAAVFSTDCGVLTNFNIAVNLRPSSESFDSSRGLIFSASPRPVDVKALWIGERELRVEASCGEGEKCNERQLQRTEKWRDVTITFLLRGF